MNQKAFSCRPLLRVIGLCALALSICPKCKGQDAALKQGTDTTYINRLISFAKEQPDPDSSIKLYASPLQLSISGNYVYGIIHAYEGIGYQYENKGNFVQGLVFYKKAFASSESSVDKVNCYFQIGTAYIGLADYVQATDNFYAGLSEQQKTHTIDRNTLDIYNGLYYVLSQLDQEDKRLYYLNQGEDLARKLNLPYELDLFLSNKGTYYSDEKIMDSARKYLLEALDISKKNNYIEFQESVNMNLGNNCIESGHYEEAIPYLRSAITAAKGDYNYYSAYIYASCDIAKALYHLGRYRQAEDNIVPALQKARQLGLKENTIGGYRTLASIYKVTGRYKEALDCMDTISALKDSGTSAEKAAAINKMDIKYKTAEKDKQLSQNLLLIAQQNNKITHKNTLIAGIAGGVLLLLVISSGIYRNSRQKQHLQAEQIKSLEQENKILEQKNKIDILKAAVEGEDNERSRISRELHDGIGGMLSAAIIRLSAIHNENEAITHISSYNEAMGILSVMGDEIRKTAHNLMPEVLLKQNLPEAVRTYCNNIQDGNFLQIDYQYYGSFGGLTENFKLNVYRIIQELLKNIIQHANATHALVQLQENENMLAITVEDNGVGFNINEPKKGIGLHNLQTRVSSLDGYLTIRSIPKKGTSVFIELPTPGSATAGNA